MLRRMQRHSIYKSTADAHNTHPFFIELSSSVKVCLCTSCLLIHKAVGNIISAAAFPLHKVQVLHLFGVPNREDTLIYKKYAKGIEWHVQIL